MEFSSYGLEVYTSEVDDHGIDFIAKTKLGNYIELQVKSARHTNYVFMQKNKWNIESESTYLVLLIFADNKLPDVYLVPATDWKMPNTLLSDKNYEGLKSVPEYGINISKKNEHLLNNYKLEAIMSKLL
ncbi:MAG: DUF4365 domain-containing protein [Clostridia bacterium]|nr:DUF4365 domain-containing protein [Clostridia bacterium]